MTMMLTTPRGCSRVSAARRPQAVSTQPILVEVRRPNSRPTFVQRYQNRAVEVVVTSKGQRSDGSKLPIRLPKQLLSVCHRYLKHYTRRGDFFGLSNTHA